MDMSADVLQSLKCSCCEAYLSRGPIYLQHDGAAVCGEVIGHEEMCEVCEQYVCPLLGSARCDWLGNRAGILQHCSSQHPDLVLQNPTTLCHDITRASTHTYLLTAFQVLFLLYTKVCLASGRIYHSVRYLGTSEAAAKYKYNLDIKRGDICLSQPGDVAPQGCLAMQEPTSLALNTNSLLDVLGGFDGITSTVTVEELARALTCAACGAVVPGLLYRGEDGWRCEFCAPARRACENQAQSCTHTDIDIKCKKHELFFCKQRTECYICDKTVSRGSLSAHYDTADKDVTYRAGSTWRATRGGPLLCLVSSVAGVAVCKYGLSDSCFVLFVYTPVSSERLSEFRCTVRLTQRNTGHTHTCTPDACYTNSFDWFIVVKSKEFPPFKGVFDVCVNIARAGFE